MGGKWGGGARFVALEGFGTESPRGKTPRKDLTERRLSPSEKDAASRTMLRPCCVSAEHERVPLQRTFALGPWP